MIRDAILSINDNMFKFAGSVKLSDNIEETKEGYLKCFNVIMGRSGYQKYAGSELSGMGFKNDEVVEVLREEVEVFREETLNSGEGKPITLNHPSVDVTVDNIKELGKGTILTKLWREGNNMIGDIIITDKPLVDKVKNKELRELSLGYSTRLIREGNLVKQTNILINHLAVLKNGRAGNAVIQDSENKEIKKEGKNMDLKEAMKLVVDSGFTLKFGDETKAEKEYQEGDEKKAKDKEKELEDKKTADKAKEEQDKKDKEAKETKEKEEADKKAKDEEAQKEKDKKGEKDNMTKDSVLKLLLDGTIDNETAKKMLDGMIEVKPTQVKDGLFGGVEPTNIQGTTDVKINDYSVVTGNELNEHFQKLHDENYSHRLLTRKYQNNNDVRTSIYESGDVRDTDFIKGGY